MAGDLWEWCLYISRESDGSWTLSGELLPVLDDDPVTIDPVPGIKDGIELYDRFRIAVITNETGIDPDEWLDVEQIRKNLLEVDQDLLVQFLEGRSTLEDREEKEAEREQERRRALIEPFRDKIEERVAEFSDKPRKWVGGSARGDVTRYIGDYVVEHGELPTGLHQVPKVGSVTFLKEVT